MVTSRCLKPSSLLLVFLLSASQIQIASADIIDFTFTGFASVDSFFQDTPGNRISLSGSPYTVTGYTISDIDVDPIAGSGRYAAISTYTFATGSGGVVSFIADASSLLDVNFDPSNEYFTLGCLPAPTNVVNCAYLSNWPTTEISAVTIFDNPFAGTADAGAIAGLSLTGFSCCTGTVPRVMFSRDGAGNLSALAFSSLEIAPATLVTSTRVAVSEPATFALFGIGLAGLGLARRRRKV